MTAKIECLTGWPVPPIANGAIRTIAMAQTDISASQFGLFGLPDSL
ncbi:hypothetical protein HGP16_02195 [Rhizobium sp. P40RR-XXII]|nr:MULTISPECIES: hypothetical protein [unclassified Rhizobium]NLR83988.1 hypothetical protein [Rhizobium sp. P28RR-XV]NLS15366.1 hypothetical protein [Rhizobium sp. P40RR-XXII]